MSVFNLTGRCMCGCGEPAPISTENRPARGMSKGHPIRFIPHHAASAFRQDRPSWTVDAESGCWTWTGYIKADGYGVANSKRWGHLAHRANYVRLRGPIPAGLDLDHLCRNRACVNPDHLEPVEHAENVRRSKAWVYDGDRPIECGRGHDLSATGALYVHRGKRECRECRNSWRSREAAS